MRKRRDGFTLAELLTVMAIIVVLMGLFLPSLASRKGAQDVTTAAYNLSGALEVARNYAISNNTYTWIGFYEQDYNSTSATGTGTGRVTVGIVYSKDGTKLVDDTNSGSMSLSSSNAPNPLMGQVGKLMQIYGIHLTQLATPTSANSTDPKVASTLSGRPYPADILFINSDNVITPKRPFSVQGYTFSQTIRFNPRGEANFDSTTPCARIIEIGLRPTHGSVVDTRTLDVVAVQQTGIGGAVTIYRQ